MKRKLLLILAAALIFSIPALPATNKDRLNRKTMIRQLDSLRKTNELLRMQIDSLYQINESLALDGIQTDGRDSINPGFIEMTGLDEFAASDTVPLTSDSLLSLWYQRRNLNLMDLEPSDIDTIVMTSDVPDSVYIARLQRLNSFISVPYNSIIRNHIIYYTQRMPEKMERILGLATYYIPIFEEIFDKYDMPLELTAMAVI